MVALIGYAIPRFTNPENVEHYIMPHVLPVRLFMVSTPPESPGCLYHVASKSCSVYSVFGDRVRMHCDRKP